MDAGSHTAGVRVRRVEFGMEWPPGHVAAYLLDADEPVLVDAGMPEQGDTFRAALADAGYEPADIEHVLLTHPHVDHIGQVQTVIDEGDPEVYAPAGVRERFRRDPDALAGRVRANAGELGLAGDRLEEAVGMAVESLERDSTLLPPEAVDTWVAGGDRIEIGPLTVGAVHAPGHQADHLCYATDIGTERALLAGDMVIEPFRAVALHDGMDDDYRDAFAAFFAALDRLAELDVDRVYPGHGPVHETHHGTVERDRGSLNRRLDAVEALVGEGVQTAPGLAVELANGHRVRYVLLEVMGALAYLEDEGRVSSELEGGVRRFHSA